MIADMYNTLISAIRNPSRGGILLGISLITECLWINYKLCMCDFNVSHRMTLCLWRVVVVVVDGGI